MFIALKCCLGMTAMLDFVVEVPKHSDPVNSNIKIRAFIKMLNIVL